MRVKGIVEEDFVNYRLPAMFISSCFCDFKCCTENGLDIGVCQNAPLVQAKIVAMSDKIIYKHFINNQISKAIVIGGLEPFLQFEEVLALIRYFRQRGETAEFVVYTGYYPFEVREHIKSLKEYSNIIVKFGRFIPNRSPRYDNILGIELASDNQYAVKIS